MIVNMITCFLAGRALYFFLNWLDVQSYVIAALLMIVMQVIYVVFVNFTNFIKGRSGEIDLSTTS
jgi:hypothetical protein